MSRSYQSLVEEECEDIPDDSQRAALGRVITTLHLKDSVQNSDYKSLYSCHVLNPLGYSQANITVNGKTTPE
ncbi:hypothetical protein EB796_017763 [Bugula neritina]|uniref:Uncharacterized protein n=1 Tax=Bugula neritina TaxID=10212 RepID=A0A7J7JD10_BUGNE|nr:hypothetical protein EB796_017763 [Bugula neritina]